MNSERAADVQREAALVDLGHELEQNGYRFTAVTPATHERVVERESGPARDRRDVFGWNLPFEDGLVSPIVMDVLRRGDLVSADGDRFRARVRAATLGGQVFLHSAYPTTESSDVFFGPDTYRFVSFLKRRIRHAQRLVDVGCGSGAGGLAVRDRAEHLVLADINDAALGFARANARLAGAQKVDFVSSNLRDSIAGSFDAVVANPPYIVDDAQRTYRHGGGALGLDLAVRIVRDSLARLPKGGQLLLYTGVPMARGGDDPFWSAIARDIQNACDTVSYEELDPDVFGEELARPVYANTERLAVVGLDVTRGA